MSDSLQDDRDRDRLPVVVEAHNDLRRIRVGIEHQTSEFLELRKELSAIRSRQDQILNDMYAIKLDATEMKVKVNAMYGLTGTDGMMGRMQAKLDRITWYVALLVGGATAVNVMLRLLR